SHTGETAYNPLKGYQNLTKRALVSRAGVWGNCVRGMRVVCADQEKEEIRSQTNGQKVARSGKIKGSGALQFLSYPRKFLGHCRTAILRLSSYVGCVNLLSEPALTSAFSVLQVGSPARRDHSSHSILHWDTEPQGQSCDGYLQADGRPLCSRDYEEHMYVNTQNLQNGEADAGEHRGPEESPTKDLFDMRPFEDALKLHESMSACGAGGSPPIEDQWPSPPTRKAPIAPTEDQLKQEPWYHGKMSRRDAEKLLQMDGDFLVRDSITNPGQYVLTGMHNGQPKHLLLVDPEGVVSN
ncbi:SHC-transforming protein 2-like, partial [Sphaerodactylus townsendi]|uniref:SHC-transforming protein 2-like n=1 Tax=Sphaerodactylus townsendi TaxID=933632 RepID=UPI0020263223